MVHPLGVALNCGISCRGGERGGGSETMEMGSLRESGSVSSVQQSGYLAS